MIFINRDFFVAYLIGITLDYIFGDPRWLPHPVQWIGALISFLEKKLLREEDSNRAKGIKGAVLAGIVIGVTAFVSLFVTILAFRINRIVGIVVMGVTSAFTIAAKSLKKAALDVYDPLMETPSNEEKARYAVSMIVGRDTDKLDKDGIIRATVETVSENTNDGVICPLFYLALGGPVLAYVYKAISTMDSMIGYKNDKYRYFGTAAARLDDIFAFVPARISAFLMIFASMLIGYDCFGAYRIWKRDRYKHESPNSAHCESVCAGALGVRLAGPTSYFGKIKDKPYIGDDDRCIEKYDIVRSIRLMFGTEGLFSMICIMIFLACNSY